MADAIPGNAIQNTNAPLVRFPPTGLVNFNGGNRIIDELNRRNGSGGTNGQTPAGGAQPNVRYQFSSNGDFLGVYNAKQFKDGPNPSVVADLTADDLGTLSDDEDIVVWVLEDIEAGARTIDVTTDPPPIGAGVVIQEDEATGWPIAVHVAPSPGKETVLVQITANASGGGKYVGTIYAGTSTAVVTGNLALPEGLTAGATVTALNPEENGLPTHWIKLDTYVECAYTGGKDGDGNPLVTICSTPVYRVASPEDLTVVPSPVTDPSELSWTRGAVTSGSAKGDCPFTMRFVARKPETSISGSVVTITYFYVDVLVDAGGRIAHVSSQTIEEVTGKACVT